MPKADNNVTDKISDFLCENLISDFLWIWSQPTNYAVKIGKPQGFIVRDNSKYSRFSTWFGRKFKASGPFTLLLKLNFVCVCFFQSEYWQDSQVLVSSESQQSDSSVHHDDHPHDVDVDLDEVNLYTICIWVWLKWCVDTILFGQLSIFTI